MTLDDFCSKGWQDHATDAGSVMARFPEGLGLVRERGDIPKLAALVAHVAGEHLGRWQDGIAILERLRAHSSFDAGQPEGKALLRSLSVLQYCSGDHVLAERLAAQAMTGGDVPEASDRARMLAMVAQALTGQHRVAEAASALDDALALASYGPGATDPAARALAVTGNNLACELEGRSPLSDDERLLMLRAAQAGRDFWAIAGGWMEVERAEYRLAMSCIKAGEIVRAGGHAAECLRIVRENGSDPGELFFAHEAVARASLAGRDHDGARAALVEAEAALPAIQDAGLADTCRTELEKLRRAVDRA